MNFIKQILATFIGILIAGIIFLLGIVIFIGVLVSSLSEDEPVSVASNSILMLTLDKPIYDRAPDDPFSSMDIAGLSSRRDIGLNEILQCIEKAKTDEKIKGIYLKLSSVQAGIATVDEIREALVDFRGSGKFLIAYADVFTHKSYFLATAAEKIYMNPEGNFMFTGLSSEVMFLKGTLDKLGIEAQIIRHGKYKSAVEPYSETQMSKESREQVSSYISAIWRHMLTKISLSRTMDAKTLDQLASGLKIKNAADALQNHLIDSALYKDELIHILSELSGNKNDKLNLTTLVEYCKTLQVDDSADKIAVIYAQGTINMSGEMDETNISAEKLAVTLREARKDSSIKAIVLRVNSPGGSALASEVIWREVQLASRTKPIVASMGDLAASGGYYIIAPSTLVLSSPVTLTGSIGVFGVILNTKEFLNKKLGITTDRVKTNEHADIFSMTRPLSGEEKAVMQAEIDRTYDTFIKHVSEGRSKDKATVDEIAQGRVWAGQDAIKIGLTDSIGGLNKAIRLAAEKAGLSGFTIVELPKQHDKWARWLDQLAGETRLWLMPGEMKELYPAYQNLKNLRQYQGIQSHMPYNLEIY